MKLGELVGIQTGFHFRGPVEPDPEGEYQVIQVKDLNPYHGFDREGLSRVSPDRPVDSYLVDKGDVLFLARGVRQMAVPIRMRLTDTIVPNHFFILRVKAPLALPEYIGWYLNQAPAQAKLKAMAQGSNVAFVAKADLAELEVPVPPMDVQKRIAAVTALAEREQQLLAALIDERERLVTALCLEAARDGLI